MDFDKELINLAGVKTSKIKKKSVKFDLIVKNMSKGDIILF